MSEAWNDIYQEPPAEPIKGRVEWYGMKYAQFTPYLLDKLRRHIAGLGDDLKRDDYRKYLIHWCEFPSDWQ